MEAFATDTLLQKQKWNSLQTAACLSDEMTQPALIFRLSQKVIILLTDLQKLTLSSTNSYFSVVPKGNYFADGFTEIDFELTYAEQDNASAASYIPNFLGSNPQLAALAGDGIAVGCDEGLSLYKHNSGNKNESAVAYITSSYNTGFMLGDIRFAGLANGGTSDRSVKSNHLTTTGSVAGVAVATNAELVGFSGFSASNYLSRASDTDFDFGTGDFSISLWVKNTNWTGTQRLLGRSQDSNTNNDCLGGRKTRIQSGCRFMQVAQLYMPTSKTPRQNQQVLTCFKTMYGNTFSRSVAAQFYICLLTVNL
jgi:hypothetical protein